jgi:ferredoxin
MDNSKCTCCGLCVDACPARAIAVANTDDEYNSIKKSIDEDPRTLNDLMVERYGASPVDELILLPISEINLKIENNFGLLTVEIVNDLDTACLIDSVPISELFDDTGYSHYKVTNNDELYDEFSKIYNTFEVPTFLLFSNKRLILKVDGVVSNQNPDERNSFIQKVKDAICH